ncbi:ribosome maturation factor RimP [Rhodothalassium salexigens]|uniref:ribosome maturation factor RimP n=1 Tax=Rhodothalassium salexigens TaxID=1086 RepID=UPI0019123E99|nr:ribosome maturation factor RimP [Rhodothalassium salexigens]MBK5921466.1 ribosome maturation factor RimP [Rhodothalassium salexigens]
MTASDDRSDIRRLIEPTAEALGFELVRVTFTGGGSPVLQIMAERADGTMSVDDCAKLSREVSTLLDVEDPIPGEYNLEVSSPGIDRPLTRPKDFERWAGFDAKVELDTPRDDGQRRFKGRLRGLEAAEVLLDVGAETLRLPLAHVAKAKLILTDDLIAAVTAGQPDGPTPPNGPSRGE